MEGLAFVSGAYLLGGVPFGLLIGLAHGCDVRMQGSRNIGATNVGRVVGRKWGYLCLVLDVLKGLVPTLAASLLLGGAAADPRRQVLLLAVALAAVLGHVFPVYLGFRGGKGVATTVGVALGIWPYYTVAMAAALAAYAIVRFASGLVSAGSLTLAVVFPAAFFAYARLSGLKLAEHWALQAAAAFLGLLIIVRHRENIHRLFSGRETTVQGERGHAERGAGSGEAEAGECRPAGLAPFITLNGRNLSEFPAGMPPDGLLPSRDCTPESRIEVAVRMKAYFRNTYQALKTILVGMRITLKYCFARTVTVQYPDMPPTIQPRVRGFHWYEIEKCSACKACARACPVDCIYIENTGPRKLDRETGLARGGAMKRYAIDYSKCMFCGLCTLPCPTECLHMGDIHDLSGYDRASAVVEFTELASRGLRTPMPLWMLKQDAPAWVRARRDEWLARADPAREEMVKALSEQPIPKKPPAPPADGAAPAAGNP